VKRNASLPVSHYALRFTFYDQPFILSENVLSYKKSAGLSPVTNEDYSIEVKSQANWGLKFVFIMPQEQRFK
jgi:hypothetical protein